MKPVSQNQTRTQLKKGNYRPISLMIYMQNSSIKSLQAKFDNASKISYTIIKSVSIPGFKDDLTYTNP
jgi:hypothetical protein